MFLDMFCGTLYHRLRVLDLACAELEEMMTPCDLSRAMGISLSFCSAARSFFCFGIDHIEYWNRSLCVPTEY